MIGITQLGNVPRTCNRISIGHTLSVHTRVVVLAGVNLQGAVSGVLSGSPMLQPSYQPQRVTQTDPVLTFSVPQMTRIPKPGVFNALPIRET